jgi:hypothetical protein
MTQPICPGCWAILHLGRPPERIAGADEEDCCLCGDPTVSGLTVHVDPTTVPYPTKEDA